MEALALVLAPFGIALSVLAVTGENGEIIRGVFKVPERKYSKEERIAFGAFGVILLAAALALVVF